MASKHTRIRTEARSLCADLHPDDGPDSRRPSRSRDDQSFERKTRQLCAQVRRALHGVIPHSESALEADLIVEAVEPDPDAGRLRLIISVPFVGTAIPRLQETLDAKIPFYRSEIAARITRKRVPMLTIELVPREDDR